MNSFIHVFDVRCVLFPSAPLFSDVQLLKAWWISKGVETFVWSIWCSYQFCDAEPSMHKVRVTFSYSFSQCTSFDRSDLIFTYIVIRRHGVSGKMGQDHLEGEVSIGKGSPRIIGHVVERRIEEMSRRGESVGIIEAGFIHAEEACKQPGVEHSHSQRSGLMCPSKVSVKVTRQCIGQLLVSTLRYFEVCLI